MMMRFAARPRDGEHGLTIVELLVAMVILGVVLAGLTAGAISVYRTTSRVHLHTDDQNQARNAIAVISRDIRAASPVRPTTDPAFLVATPTQAHFTANLDDSARPNLVRLYVDEDLRIVEDATVPDEGYNEHGELVWDTDNNAVVRYIAGYVVNDDDMPIFRYYDQNGGELGFSDDPCTGPDGGSVPPPCLQHHARGQVTDVTLSLTVSSDPNDRIRQFTVEQRIALPNLKDG